MIAKHVVMDAACLVSAWFLAEPRDRENALSAFRYLTQSIIYLQPVWQMERTAEVARAWSMTIEY